MATKNLAPQGKAIGAYARAAKLTPERRREIATLAAQARAAKRLTPAQRLAKEEAKARREKLESVLDLHIRASKLPDPDLQFQFHPTRKWRFDFAWPVHSLAVEVDGISGGTIGRHQTAAGFSEDCVKLNEAVLLGWRVLRVTGAQIKSGQAIAWIRKLLQVTA